MGHCEKEWEREDISLPFIRLFYFEVFVHGISAKARSQKGDALPVFKEEFFRLVKKKTLGENRFLFVRDKPEFFEGGFKGGPRHDRPWTWTDALRR